MAKCVIKIAPRLSSLSHSSIKMNSEKSIRDDYSIKAEPLLAGFNVLVVDDDSTSLTIISKMLGAFGYKVVTAKRASEALYITREREDELHLILTEAHLPDMDKYELLEKMEETSNLPVVIMCADEDENAMYGCLFKGAVFYLVKPLTLNNIRDLWQFAFVKKRETILAGEEMCSIQGALLRGDVSDEDVESGLFVNKIKQSHQNGKRNWEEIYDNDEEEYDNLTASKKPKLVWTSKLHNKFLQAVRVLGIDSAHPKKILQHMNVPGLKKENISSHLQKYRLSLKREQDIIQKTRIRESIVSRLASFHPSSTFNVQGGYFQFPKLESITMKPKFTTHFQKNLSRQTSISSVGSAPFTNSGSSGCSDTSNSKFGQSNLSYNLRVSSYGSINHAGTSIGSNTELAGFNQMGNTNREEVLEGNVGFRNMGNLSSGSTPNFQIFLTNSFQQLQRQQFLPPPPAPLPPPPQQQEEHDIFVTERGEIDELFDITKGSSQPFHDEDFGDLW